MTQDFDGLVEALFDGSFEQPMWSKFLELLRVQTGAEIASLLIQSPRVLAEEGIYLLVGNAEIEEARSTFSKFQYPNTQARRKWFAEGEPYTLSQILDHDEARFPEFFEKLTGPFGVAGVREIRVQEASGIDAWMSIVRMGSDFEESETQLFRRLAPFLRGALRNYVAREQERFAGELAINAVRRLHFGWLALDNWGAVVRSDYFGDQVLANSGVLTIGKEARLKIKSGTAQKELEHALEQFRAQPGSRPRAINLRTDPWLDMLLVPAPQNVLHAGGAAKVIAYVHSDNWTSLDRQTQLAELFGLTSSEAKLALALCRGKSIAEASEEIGITVQSGRTYSKSIFSKTGARGQPDLVRIIMGSIIAMAPEL